MKKPNGLVLIVVLGGGHLLPVMAEENNPTDSSCQPMSATATVAEQICQQPELVRLDKQLAQVWQVVSGKTAADKRKLLQAEQQAWQQRLDSCWQQDGAVVCARQSYERRIAELQARYQLVKVRGPFSYICDDVPASQLQVRFYASDPATLQASVGDNQVLMYRVRSASGAKYESLKEMLWEHKGEILLRWGDDAAEIHCRQKPHV